MDYIPYRVKELLAISVIGWVLVTVIEAIFYIALAFSIVNQISVVFILLLAMVSMLITVLSARTGYLSGVLLAQELYGSLKDVLAYAKLTWFNKTNTSQLTLLSSQGIPKMMSVPAHQIQLYVYTPLLPVLLVFGVWVLFGWQIAALFMVALSLVMLGQLVCQFMILKVDKKRHDLELALSQSTLEIMNHSDFLKSILGVEGAVLRALQPWRDYKDQLMKINFIYAICQFFSVIFTTLPIFGMIILLPIFDFQDFGVIAACTILMIRAASSLDKMTEIALGLSDIRHFIKDYQKTCSAPRMNINQSNPVALHNYTLDIKNLQHKNIVKKINAQIEFGARVHVSGKSGSGKTSFLELLLRYDDPQYGKIFLGGLPLQDINYDTLTSLISYVPQEPVLFTGSLVENIRLGNPDVSDEQIERIARKMCLSEVIDRSPLGIYQDIGQQGLMLSGGERQRVALARALLKKSKILILDEATAALDESTEDYIISQLIQMPVTIIFSTHRNHELWQATQCIQLENSK